MTTRRLLMALLPMLLIANCCHAADPVTPSDTVRVALNEVADVSIDGKSLSEFADYLNGRLKVVVELDWPALVPMGLDPNASIVTVSARQTKYRDTIKNALSPLKLRAGIVAGKLIISTEKRLLQLQMGQLVSVDNQPRTLETIINRLAGETGANIVLDPRLSTKQLETQVRLSLDDVPLETAVRLLTEVAGLGTVRMNNVLFITLQDRAEKLRADGDGPTPLP